MLVPSRLMFYQRHKFKDQGNEKTLYQDPCQRGAVGPGSNAVAKGTTGFRTSNAPNSNGLVCPSCFYDSNMATEKLLPQAGVGKFRRCVSTELSV